MQKLGEQGREGSGEMGDEHPGAEVEEWELD